MAARQAHWVVFVLLAAVQPAHARRSEAHTVMVLPWVTAARLGDDVAPNLDALLVDSARASGRAVLAPNEMARFLREPRRAALTCRGSAACLAKLGRRAGAEEVLYTAVEPAPAGLQVLVVWVAVVGAQARGQRLIEVADGASLQETVTPVLRELFAGGRPVTEQEAPPAPPPEVILDDLALAPLPSAPPAASAPVPAAEPEPALAPPSLTAITAIPVGPTTPLAAVESAPSSRGAPIRWLRWGGLGAGVVGVAAIAGGAVSGAQSVSAYDEAELASTTQIEAARLRRDGDASASRANLLFLVGSALAAAGAAGFTIDLFTD